MTVRNASKLRWQRDAHRALGEFLQVNGMPVITWTLPVSGALVGDVDSLTSTPAEMRFAFAEWVRQLGATVTPERVDRDGVAHLYAQFSWSKNDQVRGAIRATVYPPLEGGDVDG